MVIDDNVRMSEHHSTYIKINFGLKVDFKKIASERIRMGEREESKALTETRVCSWEYNHASQFGTLSMNLIPDLVEKSELIVVWYMNGVKVKV